MQDTHGTFKVFDSDGRDSEGMFDPCGTCFVLEIASLDKLVEYFKNSYAGIIDAVYEMRGIQISTDVTGSVVLIGTLRYPGRGLGRWQPEVNSQGLNSNLHKCHAT